MRLNYHRSPHGFIGASANLYARACARNGALGLGRLHANASAVLTLGTEWDELSIAYGAPSNSATAMELSPDRYRFALDRPIVGEPGVKWTYNGGATALLGRLIVKGTGEKLPDYARHALFDPLGLGPTERSNGLQGEAHARVSILCSPRSRPTAVSFSGNTPRTTRRRTLRR